MVHEIETTTFEFDLIPVLPGNEVASAFLLVGDAVLFDDGVFLT